MSSEPVQRGPLWVDVNDYDTVIGMRVGETGISVPCDIRDVDVWNPGRLHLFQQLAGINVALVDMAARADIEFPPEVLSLIAPGRFRSSPPTTAQLKVIPREPAE